MNFLQLTFTTATKQMITKLDLIKKNLEKINFLAKGVIVNSLFASAQKNRRRC